MGISALFIACSCFLLYTGESAETPCPFVMTPSRVVVQYGHAFTVNCTSTTDEVEGMGWESNYKGTGLIYSSHVQLNIEKVDSFDIASQCFINLKNSPQCTAFLPIIVYKIPDSVLIVSENQPIEEQQDFEMQCNVSNVAPVNSTVVTWYLGDTRIKREMLTSGVSQKPSTQSSVIKITADKDAHRKKLMCEAKFDFGPAGPHLLPIRSPPVDLHVLYKPFFKEPKVERVEVPANGKITLNCTAQGNPTPNYHWQVPKPTGQKVGHQPILDLQGPFPGTYNCTTSNSQGSSIKQFVLTDAPRDYTVLATVLGILAALGFLLLISGPFIVTKDGTFSLNKGGYSKGQPSQPI
ncbi:hypothetical protein NQD34_006281 [Periophthalmus magnuspinnatus]|nr:hypothetical protein NQD34_006281 [Periophthalmus magnuspinnatus]